MNNTGSQVNNVNNIEQITIPRFSFDALMEDSKEAKQLRQQVAELQRANAALLQSMPQYAHPINPMSFAAPIGGQVPQYSYPAAGGAMASYGDFARQQAPFVQQEVRPPIPMATPFPLAMSKKETPQKTEQPSSSPVQNDLTPQEMEAVKEVDKESADSEKQQSPPKKQQPAPKKQVPNKPVQQAPVNQAPRAPKPVQPKFMQPSKSFLHVASDSVPSGAESPERVNDTIPMAFKVAPGVVQVPPMPKPKARLVPSNKPKAPMPKGGNYHNNNYNGGRQHMQLDTQQKIVDIFAKVVGKKVDDSLHFLPSNLIQTEKNKHIKITQPRDQLHVDLYVNGYSMDIDFQYYEDQMTVEHSDLRTAIAAKLVELYPETTIHVDEIFVDQNDDSRLHFNLIYILNKNEIEEIAREMNVIRNS